MVEPSPGVEAGPELERELLDFCADKLAKYKTPKIDRLHRRDAARPERQALQAQAPRPVLGRPRAQHLTGFLGDVLRSNEQERPQSNVCRVASRRRAARIMRWISPSVKSRTSSGPSCGASSRSAGRSPRCASSPRRRPASTGASGSRWREELGLHGPRDARGGRRPGLRLPRAGHRARRDGATARRRPVPRERRARRTRDRERRRPRRSAQNCCRISRAATTIATLAIARGVGSPDADGASRRRARRDGDGLASRGRKARRARRAERRPAAGRRARSRGRRAKRAFPCSPCAPTPSA